MKDVEYLLFSFLRRKAIGRLCADDEGAVFTTQQYAESYARVCSEGRRSGELLVPPIPIENARNHLEDCEYVICIGKDEWLSTDGREGE